MPLGPGSAGDNRTHPRFPQKPFSFKDSRLFLGLFAIFTQNHESLFPKPKSGLGGYNIVV